jgi:hypothetical protein
MLFFNYLKTSVFHRTLAVEFSAALLCGQLRGYVVRFTVVFSAKNFASV